MTGKIATASTASNDFIYRKGMAKVTPDQATMENLAKSTLLAPNDSLEIHPLADLFPSMPEEQFSAFVEDIQRHGVREPVVTLQGIIVDGRHRHKACQQLGIDCPAEEYQGREEDLLNFLVSRNIHRRHLNESQRAMVAAKLANQKHGGDRSKASIDALLSQKQAAALVNVSEPSVERAARVQRNGISELQQAVEQGQVSVSAASDICDLPVEEQRALIKDGDSAIRIKAKEIREQRASKENSNANGPAFPLLQTEDCTPPDENEDQGDEKYDTDEWCTPERELNLARQVLGAIDLDPASSALAQKTVRAKTYFDKAKNGLTQPWFRRVWLNSPYSHPLIEEFTSKLIDEYESGRVTAAICLVNNATDTKWFYALLQRYPVCFTKGRVKFTHPKRDNDPGPRQGQAFFYLGDDPEHFRKVFSEIGTVLSLMEDKSSFKARRELSVLQEEVTHVNH